MQKQHRLLVSDTNTGLILWFVLRIRDNTFSAISFGLADFTRGNGTGDLPIAGADYNGDGRADITVIRRNSNGSATYCVADSVSGALITARQWGNI